MAKESASKHTSAKGGLREPLFDPKEKAKVDIVFVHGLGGDRVKTWTWEDDDRTQFWPQTLLPKDCPTARILSFGYDADFAHFYPENPNTIAPELTIDNYSASLFHALIGLRGKTNSAERPIIFVAHSLGGLVVANALSRRQGPDDADAAEKLSGHTIGALFLGTPFEGASTASWASVAIQVLSYFMPTQNKNLQDLQKRSDKLVVISDSFAKYLRERDRSHDKPFLEIACFFEGRQISTKKTKLLPSVKIGFIVRQESASRLGYDALSILKDHIQMCKFEDEDDPDYKSVSEKLIQWIGEIDNPKNRAGGKVGGVNTQIVVTQGNVDNRYIQNKGGIVAGNIMGTSPGAVVLSGGSNQTFNDYGPNAPPHNTETRP